MGVYDNFVDECPRGSTPTDAPKGSGVVMRILPSDKEIEEAEARVARCASRSMGKQDYLDWKRALSYEERELYDKLRGQRNQQLKAMKEHSSDRPLDVTVFKRAQEKLWKIGDKISKAGFAHRMKQCDLIMSQPL